MGYTPLPVRTFPVDKGTTHVVFDSCTGSRVVPWTHWISTHVPMKGFKGVLLGHPCLWPAQVLGSGHSQACSCQEGLHRSTQVKLLVVACAVASSTFSVDKGTIHVVFDSCTGSKQVPWTH